MIHRFQSHSPTLISGNGNERAAVSMVLRLTEASPEILLIERAHDHNDIWSGHLALPGGREEMNDRSLQVTATRETLEETGLELSPADYLGQLSDVAAGNIPLIISCFVYKCPQACELKPNPLEVADVFWVALTALKSAREIRISKPAPGGTRHFPALRIPGKQQPLWGITYQFVKEAYGLFVSK